MARQVLPIVGYVVGAYFGYPQLGAVVGALVASAIPEDRSAPSLGDLPVQTSLEGQRRAIIHGTSTCTGYILDFGPALETTEYVDSGGGKGSSDSTPTSVVYRSYAIAICEGPIAGLLRVWANDKLVYDMRPNSLMMLESEYWIANKNIFLGTEDQLPSAFLQLNGSGGLANTPTYAGTAYMVVGLENLTDSRGAIPQYRFEVAKATTDVPLPVVGSVTALGGGGGTWRITGSPLDIQNTGPESTDNPMMYMRAITYGTDGELPKRMVVTFSNGQSFDTGWFGNPENASALEDQLVAVDRPDLAGPLQRYANGFVPTPTELADGLTSGSQIIANLISVPCTYSWVSYSMALPGIDNTTGWNVGWKAVDPDEAPEGYTAASIPGVGVAPDGVLFAAEWGPEIAENVGGPTTVDAIVADCCDRAGLSSDSIDVSDITGINVDGMTLQGNFDAASAIDVLRGGYFFDRCEPGEGIVFVRRGAAVAEIITIDDLVEVPDLSRREQVSEVPRKMHLMYQSAVSGYAPVKADSEIRSADMLSVSDTTVQVPMVLNNPDDAAQMVVKMHEVYNADAQGEIKLVLPISKLARLPSNCIALSLRGQVRRLRIDQTELDFLAGRYSWTLRVDRQSAYTSNVTGIPIPEPTLPPSTIAGATALAVMDVSARIESEDDLSVLVAGSGALPGWHGWAYQRSIDDGASYSTVDTYTRAAVMGVLLDDVPPASEFFTDTTNAVRVQLYRDGQVLEDITDRSFLSGGGAFVLMDADGLCEVLQYRDSDAEGGGIFSLATLHRGLLNSGARAHTAGEKFVLMSNGQHVTVPAAWIGQDITNRAVSLGTSPETGTLQSITYVGRSQLEWPVASFALSRSGDNVSGSWVPRHRFGTDVAPVASANFRGYRVTIVGTGTITFDTTAQTFTQDVSSIGGAVTVSVSALNRITGAGPATSGAI